MTRIEKEFVTLDDGPGLTEMLVIPVNDDWGRIILTCNVCGKKYRMGVLAPRAKDIDPFVADARLAGWKVEDRRSGF